MEDWFILWTDKNGDTQILKQRTKTKPVVLTRDQVRELKDQVDRELEKMQAEEDG